MMNPAKAEAPSVVEVLATRGQVPAYFFSVAISARAGTLQQSVATQAAPRADSGKMPYPVRSDDRVVSGWRAWRRASALPGQRLRRSKSGMTGLFLRPTDSRVRVVLTDAAGKRSRVEPTTGRQKQQVSLPPQSRTPQRRTQYGMA